MDSIQSADYYTDIDDATFLEMCDERFRESDNNFNPDNTAGKKGQEHKLRSVRDDNRKYYTGAYVEEQLIDERYQEVFSDNRMFINVRTIVPFTTGQLTAPEVTPANGDDLSILFAKDFEKVLQQHFERQLGKFKVRLSVQDLVIGERVGIGKWRFDGELGTVVYEHRKPQHITIGIRSQLYDEPDYIRETIKMTAGQVAAMFPDKKQDIFDHFGIADEPDLLDKERYDINEEWLFVCTDTENYTYELVVGWSHNHYCFGKIRNPNWNESGRNVVDHEMMPYVFYNVLNDGTNYIDNTSYAEQAKYNQKNYNKRGQTIAESARYSGTGVPIFAKGAITQKDAAKVHFSPVQRVLLDTADVGKSFTIWQAQNLPQFIEDDKKDLKMSIDDIYGSPDIMRGETSGNPTAAQDILVRDQAQGRQTDILDMLEVSMTRSYQLEAQLMYIYFTEAQSFAYIGNDSKFVTIVIKSKDIAKNLGIQIGVKAGTSLLPDRAQKRRTLVELAKMNRIATYTLYRELNLFDDPDRAYKEWVNEQANPALQNALSSVINDTFDREANEDLQTVIGGKIPDERDDISPEYVEFLNQWLLTDKYKHLQEDNPKAAARVSDFVDNVIAQAQRKATKQQLQPVQPGQGQPPMMPPGAGGAPGGAPGPNLMQPQLPPMMPGMAGAMQPPGAQPPQTPTAPIAGGLPPAAQNATL